MTGPNRLFLPGMALAAALLALPPTALPQTETGVDCTASSALDFMLGAWRVETEGTVFSEEWRRADDGSLVGEASSGPAGGNELQQTEAMVIAPVGGVLTYTVEIDHNGRPVSFPLVRCDGVSARFENPDHDFPQRLDYRAVDGGLIARVADLDDNGFDLEFEAVGTTP